MGCLILRTPPPPQHTGFSIGICEGFFFAHFAKKIFLLLQVRHISNDNKNDNLQLTQELSYNI